MSELKPHHLFCFGFGYCCDYLARALSQKGGWRISGTTRDLDKKGQMEAQGISAYFFNTDKPLGDLPRFMEGVTHLLVSTPPDDDGDPVFNLHADAILDIPTLQWAGYLSSTSIYGDRGGDWVDETAEPQPRSQRGSRRLKAEEQWLSLYKDHDLPVHIFRLAGIYGPGRSALDSLKAGRQDRLVDKPGHVFNRIHVEDIVRVLMASFEKPNPGAVYNVSDDYASPSHEVVSHACKLLGMEPPPLVPFNEADLSPMARSFYTDNKRLRNDRIKKELGVKLAYPDYRSGLEACLEAEEPDFRKTYA